MCRRDPRVRVKRTRNQRERIAGLQREGCPIDPEGHREMRSLLFWGVSRKAIGGGRNSAWRRASACTMVKRHTRGWMDRRRYESTTSLRSFAHSPCRGWKHPVVPLRVRRTNCVPADGCPPFPVLHVRQVQVRPRDVLAMPVPPSPPCGALPVFPSEYIPSCSRLAFSKGRRTHTSLGRTVQVLPTKLSQVLTVSDPLQTRSASHAIGAEGASNHVRTDRNRRELEA